MEPQTKLDPLTETTLRSLRDIAVPPPVSWMPQTLGWLLVAIILMAAVLVWATLAYRRWQRNAYRREALTLLGEIEIAMRNSETQERAVTMLGELVKRTALAAWPRNEVAAASGADWVGFIAAHGGDVGDTFKSFFDDLEYQHRKPIPGDVADDLLLGARRWIERHHVSA